MNNMLDYIEKYGDFSFKEKAFNERYDVLIIDTAGRLEIDDVLMEELKNIKREIEEKVLNVKNIRQVKKEELRELLKSQV